MYFYQSLLVTLLLTVAHSKLTYHPTDSAATEAQIKFAEENKYDQTGPGAKEYEGAFKTYSKLEDALLGYLDDPDTKLPEHERNRVVSKYRSNTAADIVKNKEEVLLNRNIFHSKPLELSQPAIPYTFEFESMNRFNSPKYRPFRTIELEVAEPVFMQNALKVEEPKPIVVEEKEESLEMYGPAYIRPRPFKLEEPTLFNKVKSELDQPIVVNSSVMENDDNYEHKDIDYTFSYGVHDRHTGDSKTVHETRSGGAVHGYYTVMDPDGHQRTVRYTADDVHGFRATVDRTPSNRGYF